MGRGSDPGKTMAKGGDVTLFFSYKTLDNSQEFPVRLESGCLYNFIH